jgi:predicted permease
VTIGLGIGANAAIFSVVNAVLLEPLPYRDPDRLVVVLHHGTDPVAPANVLDWRAQATSFSGLGAAELWSATVTGIEQAERLTAVRITADLFPILGVTPVLGRLFGPADEVVGQDRVVILSDALWRRRFGADRGIIGRSISLNGQSHLVVGVMGPTFGFPPFWAEGAELWAPLSLGPRASSRSGNSLRAFARLRTGVTIDEAQSEINLIAARLEATFPGTNRDVRVVGLADRVVGPAGGTLVVLLGAVGFVLLIACGNVAHMQLARGSGQRREVAVRAALGASRRQIVARFLAESLVLAILGGGLGLALAWLGAALLAALGPASLPRLGTVAVDGAVIGFTAVAAGLSAIGFGLVPAITASRVDLTVSLKEGARGSTGHRGGRARDWLVASEFALAVILCTGAGLSIRSFVARRQLDPGFDPTQVTTAVISVASAATGAPARRVGFYSDLVEQVEQLPAVTRASAINHLPLAGDIWRWPYHPEGRPLPKPGEEPAAAYRVVLPGYFETMRLALVAGRDFTAADRLGQPGIVIVNQALAQQEWPGEDPLGKRLTFLADPTRPEWLTVTGVAENATRDDWTAAPGPELYLPWLQSRPHLLSQSQSFAYLTLVVRTNRPVPGLGGDLRRLVASIDRDVAVSDLQTMGEVVTAANADSRFYLVLLGAFAGLALVLAAIGIYGVIGYGVVQRRREIGIRLTLGATRGSIVALVVIRGTAVALIGAAVGLAGAFGLTRLLASILFGVPPTDPFTFVVVPLGLAAVAVGAAAIPAFRAAAIEPLAAVRAGGGGG